jgi:hypothetical protein
MVEPGVLVAEQRPGPSWFDGLDAPQRPTGAPQAPSVAALARSPAAELGRSRELRGQVLADDARLASPEMPPEETFIDIVDGLVKIQGMSYGQACKEASISRPDLYAEHRARSMI